MKRKKYIFELRSRFFHFSIYFTFIGPILITKIHIISNSNLLDENYYNTFPANLNLMILYFVIFLFTKDENK